MLNPLLTLFFAVLLLCCSSLLYLVKLVLFFVFLSRALPDPILPLFTLTWSLCATTGMLKSQVSTIKMSHDQGSVKRILLFLRVRLVERGAPQSLPLMESGTVSMDCWLKGSGHRPRRGSLSSNLKPFLFFCKILPGVRVIIVNPETRGPLGDSHLGEVSSRNVEAQLVHSALFCIYFKSFKSPKKVDLCVICLQIWVSSSHNASGYYTIYGEESLQADHFNTKLSFGDPQTLWARTGYLGFIKRTELLDASGGEETSSLHCSRKYKGATCSLSPRCHRSPRCLVCGGLSWWNVGAEGAALSPHRYRDVGVASSSQHRWKVRVFRRLVCGWIWRSTVVQHFVSLTSAVFTWTNLLVVVAELSGSEQEALDLVPLVTNVVLEEHHLIVGVVVIVDPGVIPINSRGEKQRMHLRDSFLADQLDPIYVAYNMWSPPPPYWNATKCRKLSLRVLRWGRRSRGAFCSRPQL